MCNLLHAIIAWNLLHAINCTRSHGFTAKMFIALFVWQRNHSLFGPVGLQSTASVNDSELNALSWSMDEPTRDRRQSLAHSTSYGGFVYGWTDRFRDSIG